MKRFLTLNPNSILFVINAVIAALTAWGLNVSPDVAGAITVIATAVITIISAAATRPVGLQLITGAAASALAAFSAFGLHLSTDQISRTMVLVSLVLAGILHLAHTPVTAWRQGTTADELAARADRAAGRMAR